jgi:shikimate dehydrogenase
MRLFGLIGFPLGHSFSKKYFTEKFKREGITDAEFELYPISKIDLLPSLLESHPRIEGLSVTIPYKEAVFPYLNDLDETARDAGAVNCVRIRGGKRTGFNTDLFGFRESLRKALPQFLSDKPGIEPQALILGTGGASKAVSAALRHLHIPHRFVSRTPDNANELSYAGLLHDPALRSLQPMILINTTPLGTSPNTETCPDLPYELLGPQHFVYDLVYNPAETLLLRRSAQNGCTTMNGLEMLHLQAEKAWEIWQA